MKDNELRFYQMLSGENIVYHYTKTDTAINEIIPKKQLKFNSLSKSDDPDEYIDPGFMAFHWGLNKVDIGDLIYKAKKIITDFRQDKYKIACFCRNNQIPFEHQNDVFYHNHLGCTFKNMWIQYGENNKGVVFAFDKNEIQKELDHIINGNVKTLCSMIHYDHISPGFIQSINGNAILEEGVDSYCHRYIRDNSVALFFTKDPSFQSENEIRFAAYNGIEPLYVNIAKAIKGIFLGSKFSNEQIPRLVQNAKGLEIPIHKLQYLNRDPYFIPVSKK